jgi:ParB family transcriptional regulator, chromosome partitioning protein
MRRSLGKGLSQLIGEQFESNPTEVSVDCIVPNQRQPRSIFAPEPLKELAASIKEFGILQPLLVRPLDENSYELIAGERRLRAAKLAGLTTVPILIRPAGSQTSLELALIENVQREDINGMESARAYRRLTDEFGLTQEQVADRVGKSRTTISNTLRLLRLPSKIQNGLSGSTITEGHARALLAIEDEIQQLKVYDQIVDKGLSVREVERLARKPKSESAKPSLPPKPKVPELMHIEQALSEKFGARVQIGGGEISFEYYGDEDLERILQLLGVTL